jgi:hypothetical protein
MTTRADLRDAVVDRLRPIAALQGRVYPSRAWPLPGAGLVDAGAMPAGLVYVNGVRRTTLSGGMSAPKFRAIVSIAIHLRAQGLTVELVDATLDQLEAAVDEALLEDPTFVAIPEEITGMDMARKLSAEGDQIVGEQVITLDLQMTETFEPKGLPPLATARIVIDAIDPADRSGPYPAIDPFPPPAAPPRPRGPDGRAEADPLTITFPES